MHRATGPLPAVIAAVSLCFVTTSYALPAGATPTSVGKPLVLVNVSKSKHARKTARLHKSKSAKAAAKPSEAKRPKVATEAPENQQTPSAQTLPATIANAHAELTQGDVQANGTQSTMTEADRAASPTDNGVQIAAADQLNDMDRDVMDRDTVAQTPADPAPVQVAAVAPPAAQAIVAQAVSSRDSDESWLKVSLIGKIFIGIGAMMTLASAARMLIA